jgi:hypothetical protein
MDGKRELRTDITHWSQYISGDQMLVCINKVPL